MVKTKQIKSLGEYITYLAEHHDADDLLFRGQSNDDPLIPKLGRIRLARPTSEREMFNEFVRQLPSHVPDVPSSDWEKLAIAQHHGMATRYLDWTTNPLAALWFAVEHPFRKKATQRSSTASGDDCGVVWILKPKKAQKVTTKDRIPFNLKEIKVYTPRLISARISAQAAFFTVHPPNQEGVFPALEEDPGYVRQLTKIEIPSSVFASLRRSLDRCGFNAASMMVDLDGVACHIAWQHSLMDDEDDDAADETIRAIAKSKPGLHIYRG